MRHVGEYAVNHMLVEPAPGAAAISFPAWLAQNRRSFVQCLAPRIVNYGTITTAFLVREPTLRMELYTALKDAYVLFRRAAFGHSMTHHEFMYDIAFRTTDSGIVLTGHRPMAPAEFFLAQLNFERAVRGLSPEHYTSQEIEFIMRGP